VALIELKNINYAYGAGEPVLRDLGLLVEVGEMVAIQGPSGSGKSTLLYLVGCLLDLQSGTLRIGGRDMGALSQDGLAAFRHRELGFIFQQFHLLPRATVLENILLPCRDATPEQVLKAKSIAASLGLGDRLEHLPNALSGGQQQRAAIARALMNDPAIILADEPTGNLDSASSSQIMDLLCRLGSRGITVIIITHDSEVAARAGRIVTIRDGRITGDIIKFRTSAIIAKNETAPTATASGFFSKYRVREALANLGRNKLRSILTMTGITIGIAAVLAMTTIGQFTKRKILESYMELGANTLAFYGYPNWSLRATDKVEMPFNSFDWKRDMAPLKKIFPEITLMSPMLRSWDSGATFGGRVVNTDVRLYGVNEDGLALAGRALEGGRNLSKLHVEFMSNVCLVGAEIAKRLFININPLGRILQVTQDNNALSCKIIGILKHKASNNEWNKPDFQIIVPYTYFEKAIGNPWQVEIHNVLLQVTPGTDIRKTSNGIKAFFKQKYGNAGQFGADSDSLLVAQMEKFLTLFTILLGAIALISLAVGGIGITNMMLVSVSERYREIGLRKALGATNLEIRTQFMVEAVVICLVAGLVGLAAGFAVYEGIIFGASKVVTKLQFEWVFDYAAAIISFTAIMAVGVLSGLLPALKAEKLQVIEALRNE